MRSFVDQISKSVKIHTKCQQHLPCGLNTRRYKKKKKDFLPFVDLVLHLISKFTYIVYEFVFAAADNGDGDADADDVATAAATIANSVSDIRTQHL